MLIIIRILNNKVEIVMDSRWRELGFKDRAQYIMAISLIISGIIIAFVNFYLTFNIANGVLIYIAQAFVAGGSIFGVSIYFAGQLGQFESKVNNKIINEIKDFIDKKDKDKNKDEFKD